MTLIATHELQPGSLNPSDNLQTYCGLDTCVTYEVLEALREIPHHSQRVYNFSRALQAPYLDIMLRGFAVDRLAREHATNDPEVGLRPRRTRLEFMLDRLAVEVWGKPINPRSPAQLKKLFYEVMRLPEVWINQKGERKLSTNREALEKLEVYLYARPLISLILSIRDLSKQLEVLEIEIDSDGRFRTSYNIAGTETGRPSSSSNAFGTGGNAQNIAPSLRYVFVADKGYKLCVIDLEQVEARDTGWFCGVLFDSWAFLDNCEAGDLHTKNAKLVWPELPWPGTPKGDRAIADRLFYRDFSYRDLCKRLGHLIDYMGTPWTASRVLRLPLGLVEDFYSKYVGGASAAYPEIPRYWQWVAEQLQTKGYLTTPFGRTRHFFGRPGDDTTLREAIAFLPQSTTADRMNLGMWRIWKYMPQVQLLAQTYDSVTFQYPESADENEIIGRALELTQVPFVSPNGRTYAVPAEAKIGWNWGNIVEQSDVDKARLAGKKPPRLNPAGLRKWSRTARDERVRATGLQRIML